MKKLTQKVKQKVNDDPELFLEAPLLIIALNFMSIGGYLIFDGQISYGFTIMAFSAIVAVLEKYLERNNK